MSGRPFDDFRDLLARLPEPDERAGEAMRARLARAARDEGPLGDLGEIAVWLARWSGRPVSVSRPLVALFAGSHGTEARLPAQEGASVADVVSRIGTGALAVNRICGLHDLGLKVFELALDLPTGDFTVDAALDERACAATMAFGMEAIAGGTDLVAVGGLGAGADAAAAALLAALLGGVPGAFLPDTPQGAAAVAVAARGLELHAGHCSDPLEALRRLGGREFAAIAGAILAARMEKVPVIVDGVAGVAAAAVLNALRPDAIGHCRLAALPSGPGYQAADRLGLKPLIGPAAPAGISAALAVGLVKTAVAALPRG